MRALRDFASQEAARVAVLFADIDETITTGGRLTSPAFSALWRLQEAGIAVIPVTGRPAGWCDHIARMWPVAGIVGENGALYFSYDSVNRRMREAHVASQEERLRNRARLETVLARILEEVPGARPASDQAYRIYDLAIDFCEDVARLKGPQVQRIVQIFEDAGATAKISSIHVNGWFGQYDKLGMMRRIAREVTGIDIDSSEGHSCVAYVGDSPNDEPAFAFFQSSVGVANVRDFDDRIVHLPRFVTMNRSGAGFCELADHLIEARSGARASCAPLRSG